MEKFYVIYETYGHLSYSVFDHQRKESLLAVCDSQEELDKQLEMLDKNQLKIKYIVKGKEVDFKRVTSITPHIT